MRLFGEGTLAAALESRAAAVLAEIDAVNNDQVLKTAPAEMEEYFVQRALARPVILKIDDHGIEEKRSTRIPVPQSPAPGPSFVAGTRLYIAIPYEGEKFLLALRPAQNPPQAPPSLDVAVHDDRIVFEVAFADSSADEPRIKAEIDRNLELLSQLSGLQRSQVDSHNESVRTRVVAALDKKREAAAAALGVVERLGIPMRRREEPSEFVAPIQRREIIPRSAERFEPSHVLPDEEYDHILKVLTSMSLVIERNPESFQRLTEPHIRDHFLIQLNGHYYGSATGETFNGAGKTDILLRIRDRNAFIAECKFWKGPKSFSLAIDQLLSYLTWRDCKCALFIFNRRGQSPSVAKKMHTILTQRPEYRRTILEPTTEGAARYVLVREGQEIVVATQLFEVPRARRGMEAGAVSRETDEPNAEGGK